MRVKPLLHEFRFNRCAIGGISTDNRRPTDLLRMVGLGVGRGRGVERALAGVYNSPG